MSTIPMPTAKTPLLSPLEEEFPKSMIYSGSSTKPNNYNNSNNNNNSSSSVNDHELHFYNPAVILDISREVAFAYLILLTGGAVDYVAPTSLVEVEGAMASSTTQQPQSISESNSPPSSTRSTIVQEDSSKKKTTTDNLDDETASSLAYSAIVDGNVLNACFGQKITPNGRVCNNSVGPKIIDGGASRSSGGETNPPRRSSPCSLFCCFPLGGGASSPTLDALHLALSNLSSDRTKMQHLAEILREVREMHLEPSSLGGECCAVGAGVLSTPKSTKVPLHLQVIRAYIHCFASIVRYHDAKEIIVCSHGERNRKNVMKKRTFNIICTTNYLKKINILSRKKSNITNPRLEQLRTDTLHDIGKGFHGLKEDIWESLERVATETSFTGCASLEESTLGESISQVAGV